MRIDPRYFTLAKCSIGTILSFSLCQTWGIVAAFLLVLGEEMLGVARRALGLGAVRRRYHAEAVPVEDVGGHTTSNASVVNVTAYDMWAICKDAAAGGSVRLYGSSEVNQIDVSVAAVGVEAYVGPFLGTA